MATKAKMKKLTLTEIAAPGPEPAWCPEAYRPTFRELVAQKPHLGVDTVSAQRMLAATIAAERFECGEINPMRATITSTGRILAAHPKGGFNDGLKLGWFDPGGPVAYSEYPGVWKATDFNAAPDAARVVWVDQQGKLHEATLADSSQRIVWEPDGARMTSYSYDYLDPDHLLLVIGMRAGGCEAHLLARRDGKLETIATDPDADCEDVEPVPPFAFLFAKNHKKAKVLELRDGTLASRGMVSFDRFVDRVALLDGQLVFSEQDKTVYRLDGL